MKEKKRTCKYGKDVIAVLVKVWEIFDRPCGQRLKICIEEELFKLYSLKEIFCSFDVLEKLKTMSPATIDRKLKHEKEVLKFNLHYRKKRHSSLLSEVPIKTSTELTEESQETYKLIVLSIVAHQ